MLVEFTSCKIKWEYFHGRDTLLIRHVLVVPLTNSNVCKFCNGLIYKLLRAIFSVLFMKSYCANYARYVPQNFLPII